MSISASITSRSLVQTLREAGLEVEEYNQTLNNLTEATEALYSAFLTKNLRLYPAPDLRQQVLNAVSVETPRGIRLSKQKTSNKIDGAVALSFAVLSAIQYGRLPNSDSDEGRRHDIEVYDKHDRETNLLFSCPRFTGIKANDK